MAGGARRPPRAALTAAGSTLGLGTANSCIMESISKSAVGFGWFWGHFYQPS